MRTLLDRRDFLKAAGAGMLALLPPSRAAALAAAGAVYATAYGGGDGGYGIAILSEDGQVLHTEVLPGRGHDITFDPRSGRSVAFARRPGLFAVVFDHRGRAAPVTITAAPGRHFFGHGVFSPDGRLLYATENDYDAAAGMIGVYDATDGFSRIGEFPSFGMDPHEILLMPDGRTLAIANGGIETHPDFGRAKLNLATMEPSLVFVDARDGTLVEKHVLDPALHQLSIRHMDLDAAGGVWFGCQYEGPASDRPQLLGRAAPGEPVALIAMPDEVLATLQNYIGSVSANRDAGTIAVTSPQGNALVVLDAGTERPRAVRPIVDVCGLAPEGDGYLATTGEGLLLPASGGERLVRGWAFDNHVLRIG